MMQEQKYSVADATMTAQIQELVQQRADWASIINRLACLVLSDEVSSNDRDDAQDAIEMVMPYLEGVE